MSNRMNRRKFLKSGCTAAAGLSLHSSNVSQKGDLNKSKDHSKAPEWRNRQSGMTYRRLGRTGFMISEIVMGGGPVSPTNYEHVELAIDMGLNYLDTAPAYGNTISEQGYGVC